MDHRILTVFALLLAAPLTATAQDDTARTPHASMWLTAPTGTYVPFNYTDEGTEYVCKWGLDTAWDDESNVRRGTAFIGTDYIGTGRISFQPSDLVDADGNLSATQQSALLSRINHIKLSGTTEVTLNCDHEALNSDNYYGKPEEWYKVIKASALYAQQRGLTITAIAPFNEPDYTYWGEGTQEHMKAICKLLSEDEDLSGIRISAGNTLNCDQAASWYNYMKPYVSEGNTHQLAGSFDSYASFFTTVRNDGNYATADELHNVMEAMVGVEYGLQSGIWWGFDGVARGDFCQANTAGGARLGYGEDRSSWTAASVYRLPSGSVEAFLGTSERQATTHSYQFLSTAHEVYYDGYGPVRTYGMEMPGGTGYQTGQTNAERMIRITHGDDVQPFVIEADTFVLMNKKSKKVITIQSGSTANGTSLVQAVYRPASPQTYQQWVVARVDDRIGGDFSYYTIRSVRNAATYIDLLNWSLTSGGELIAYTGDGGNNEQWYLEYAGDGDFYIRSRHSTLAVEVRNGSNTVGAKIQQGTFTGSDQQRWRLIPVSAACELDAPAAPTGLTATPQPASVLLSWAANTEEDLSGYMVLRGQPTVDGIDWNVIGREVSDTQFIDNTCDPATTYYYKIRAIDFSCNLSAASDSIAAAATGEHTLIARYEFDGNLTDNSANSFDGASMNEAAYSGSAVKSGTESLTLSGDNYVLLPHEVGNLSQLTIAMWVNMSDVSTAWQRIFDFGNSTDQYMFLTPTSGSTLRLVLKNGGAEQMLTYTRLTKGWHHVAVTLGADSVKYYLDGKLKQATADITIRPSDFHPVLNYIGRSQYAADPYLKAQLDDFRIYNYELSATEIQSVMNDLTDAISTLPADADAPVIATEYFTTGGLRVSQPQPGINIERRHHADGTVSVRKVLR